MPYMRQFDGADFTTSASSDLLVPSRKGGVYRAFLNTSDAVALVNEYNRGVNATKIGTPTYTASDCSVTANAASPARGINTGIVTAGDVVASVLTNKAGAMGLFSASLAASNANVIGFQATTTQLQFHNGNSVGAAAVFAWPADLGTKKLFATGWGRVHGFPFMAVYGNGGLLAIVTGTVAGGDRVPTAGDHVWYWARPNGGNGVGLPSFGELLTFIPEETTLLARNLALYLGLRALPQFAGLIY